MQDQTTGLMKLAPRREGNHHGGLEAGTPAAAGDVRRLAENRRLTAGRDLNSVSQTL